MPAHSRYLGVLALACLAGGCTSREGSRTPEGSAPDASIAATYRGGTISQDDVARELNRLPPQLREGFASVEGRKELARTLVDKRLLVEEARKRGIDADPEIRRQVAELEERLVVQALLAAEEKAKGPASEAELRAYFDGHKVEFEQPERVRVKRVLAAAGPSASPADRARAKARAERWAERLKRGEAFEKLAAEGDGAERAKGGDFGFVVRGAADDAALAEAALDLKEGSKPSTLVSCRDGWALLQLVERRERRLPSFEEVRSEVEGRLAPVRKRKVFDELLARLRAGAEVKVNATSPR